MGLVAAGSLHQLKPHNIFCSFADFTSLTVNSVGVYLAVGALQRTRESPILARITVRMPLSPGPRAGDHLL